MKTFQTIGQVNAYFEQQLEILELDFEKKQQTIEKNEQQIRTTLEKQHVQQLKMLEQQQQDEENTLRTNSALAIGKIKSLFQNKREMILNNYEDQLKDHIQDYEVTKIELVEQQQAEERAKFKAYQKRQRQLLAKAENSYELVSDFEQQLDWLQLMLMELLAKYERQFEQLEQQYEENYEQLEQQRDEAIEKLVDNEEASQNQLDNQLFEALQDLYENTSQQREMLEQSYIEKEQSLEEMVRVQHEKIDLEYEQKRMQLFEDQEQALTQFD